MNQVEVFEDSIELHCESASIRQIRAGDPASLAQYPLPLLVPSGNIGPVTLPVVILENAFLRLTFAPSLGGRLLHVFDRRTQSHALRNREELRLAPSWQRGAGLDEGIVPLVGRALGSLGPVDFVVRQWDDGSASFVTQSLEVADDWSWHATWTLAPNAARLQLVFRALNRSRRCNVSGIGVSFGGCAESWDGPNGFAVRGYDGNSVWRATTVTGAGFQPITDDDSISAYYLLPGTPVAPRQTVSFSIDLSPFSGSGELVGISSGAAAWIDKSRLRLQVDRNRRRSIIFLLTSDGQTLEMPIDLVPDLPADVDLASVKPGVRELYVRDESGETLLRSNLSPLTFQSHAVGTGEFVLPEPSRLWPDETTSMTHRAIAWYEGALEALRAKDWQLALERIDEALLYAGDDHLAWWLRAVTERHAGIEESPSLTNAHYLAPLEPLLRIESFLRQPPGGHGPSSIILPIGQNSDALVEGAIRMIEAGLDDDAVRWIDEALRHQDLVMLRFLAAWRLGEGANKLTEAAIFVRAAESLPSDLPLPNGEIAWNCIDWLANRFPDSSRIKGLLELHRALSQVADQ